MKKTVMIVEDEARIREFVGLYLRKEGYDVVEACDGEDAVEKFKTHDIDLIVLDVMMPKLNGFEVCQRIREKSSLPIIILTAVEEESEHVRGYELGADDYVTKPFKVKILIAKINRIFEKTSQLENKNVFEYEGLKADFDGRSASLDGRDIKLAPKEFELLYYLIQNNGIALSRDRILERIWGYDFEGDTRVVDNHIKKLRNKLGEYSKLIHTVVSVGYKFEVKKR